MEEGTHCRSTHWQPCPTSSSWKPWSTHLQPCWSTHRQPCPTSSSWKPWSTHRWHYMWSGDTSCDQVSLAVIRLQYMWSGDIICDYVTPAVTVKLQYLAVDDSFINHFFLVCKVPLPLICKPTWPWNEQTALPRSFILIACLSPLLTHSLIYETQCEAAISFMLCLIILGLIGHASLLTKLNKVQSNCKVYGHPLNILYYNIVY